MLKLVFSNILGELFQRYGQKILLSETYNTNYILVIYNENNQIIDEQGLYRQLEEFIRLCKNYYLCNVACYSGNELKLIDFSDRLEKLMRLRDDNVSLNSKVFCLNESKGKKLDLEIYYNNITNWTSKLLNGGYQIVKKESIEYISKLSDAGSLDAEVLKRIYQNYLQMIFKVAEQMELPIENLFKDIKTFEKSIKSYITIDDMYEMIEYSMECFENSCHDNLDEKDIINQMKKYIKDNIEKDIRREDIADTVYLSVDYISRVFKQKVGVSLKEYITISKMKEAQILLQTTSLQISLIASKVGYSNFSHFSQVYKRIIGITPTEERELI